MKHLFTFRNRPSELLTPTSRNLNGGRTGVGATVKQVSNDCRMTLDRPSTYTLSHSSVHQQAATLPNNAVCGNSKRLCRSTIPSFKKVASLLLLFALSFGFSQQAWGITVTGGKVYYNNAMSDWSDTYKYLAVLQSNYFTTTSLSTISNTKLLYCSAPNHSGWQGENGICFFQSTGKWDAQSNPYSTITTYSTGYTNSISYDLNNSNNYYLFNPSAVNGKSVTASGSWNSTRDNLFKLSNTIKVVVKKAGSTSYAAPTSSSEMPASEVKVVAYYLNGDQSATSNTVTLSGTTYSKTYYACPGGKHTLTQTANTGYTFDGFYIGDTKITNTSAYYQTSNSKITIEARYTENTYSVSATADPSAGGTVTPTTATAMGQISGGNITATENTGYTFSGWEVGTATGTFTDASSANTTFKPTQAGTVVAKFTENLTSVAISYNGKGEVSPENASVGVATTQSVTATPATGYHFASWAVTGNADIKSKTTDNPVTLYGNGSGSTGTLTATFAGNTYTVAFNANGGDAAAPANISGTYDVNLSALPIYEGQYAGFAFGGWNTNAEGTGTTYEVGATPKNLTTVQGATVTLYAKWIENSQATIIMAVNNANGGTITPAAGEYTKEVGSSFPISAEANKGYNFTGWEISNTDVVDFGTLSGDARVGARKLEVQPATSETANNNLVVKSAGSATVTANFTAKTTTLTLNGNRGTPESQALTMSYDATSLPADYVQPTRTGYDYSGYGVSTAASTTKIILKDNTFTTSSGDTQSKWVTGGKWTRLTEGTLYACWTAHYKTIDLNKHYTQSASAGYGADGKAKITVGTATATDYKAATRTGHILLGYSVDEEGTTMVIDKDGDFIASVTGYTDSEGKWIQDITNGTITKLYAQWQECMTTVTVTTEHTDWGKLKIGGSNKSWGETVEVSKLKESYQLTATANTGYKFIKWELNDGAVLSTGTLTDASIKVKGDSVHTTGTATANFEEDLNTGWRINLGYDGLEHWFTNDFVKKSGETTQSVGYVLLNLPANYNYKFKVVKKGDPEKWYGNSNNDEAPKYWIKGDVSDWTFSNDAGDCYMQTTVAGTYTFKVDYSGSNPKVSVTYPTTYKVTIASNLTCVDGSGTTINNQDIIEPGTQLVFTATDRTAAGYNFDGFYSQAGKQGKITGDGVDVEHRTYTVTPTADIEVHAGYTPIAYNITYEVNGGQAVTEHLTYTVETATFDLPTPLFTGNAFQGWYDNSEFTGSKITQITKGSKGDKTFYARWKEEGLYLNINIAGTGETANWQQYKFDGTNYTITLPKNDTYTFSLREVKAGVDDKWYKNAQTWTETGQKEIGTTGDDSKVTTLSAIDGNYTFTVDKADGPSQLTITYPAFSCNITTEHNVMPNAPFNVTIKPTATGFTPTKYMLCVQKDGGEYTEVGEISNNSYSFTPSGAGSYIFKVRAYASETDYLESTASTPVTVAGLSLEATIQTVPVNTQVMITPSTNVTGSYYVCYALTKKPDGSTKTDADIQPVAESNQVTFSADVIGEYQITATLRDAACSMDGRDLASTTITLTAIEQYKIYFKKANITGWGENTYVYFNPTWSDQSGVTNYQEGVEMTLVDGTTDVFWANVPNITPINGVVFGAKWFEKSTTFTECLVAYRQDFNKEYPYFVQDPTHKGDFGSCYSYGDGRWFRYATDKGYKLVVGTTEYPLNFPSEASIVPAAIDLQMEGNQTLDLTLTNEQGKTFYLPNYLEISNHDNLVMTETDNNNKFLTAVAGQYTVTITFNQNVMPVISSTFPAVPAPSVTFTEKRFNGETELTFTGNGTEGNPYKFFLDEKMTLSISALPEVKGLAPQYKFGDGAASETNSYTLTTSSTEVQTITMEAYYEKGTVKSGSATKTVYYQGVAVPALHLSTTATNNEVNFDSWTGPTLSYRADNYTGSATITMNGNEFQTPSGTSQDYTITQPANPMFQKYMASATIDSREFKDSLTLTVYRNVLVKMEDVNGAMGSKKVHLWRDNHGGGTTWPGIDFTTVFGNWKVFNMKYPVYDRWIVNDADAKQTEDQSIDGTTAEICCKTGDSYAGTGDNTGKTFYKVIYDGVKCPGHILVDDVPDQNVDKDATILVALPIHLMTGVQDEDITLDISVADGSKVTATQSGMSILVTGNAAGETNVTVDAYYHKDQGDEEHITKTFKVTVTAMITVQVKTIMSDGWWGSDNLQKIHYWGTNVPGTSVVLTKDGNDGTYYKFHTRIPLGTDNKINFLIFYAETIDACESEKWRKTTNIENVTTNGCYTVICPDDHNEQRTWKRDGDYCWQDINYQVVINMNNGTQYVSNTVTNAGDKLSFFAPGASETGYKAGLVRLMNAGAQVAVIPATSFATSGVYVADINTELNGLTNINLYTGDYYIRTDAAGGWKDYKDAAHKFTEFAMLDGEIYDHYWVANYKLQNDETKVNLQACVGNEYNDNLANKLVDGKGTDEVGNVIPDANGVNIRFAYNPATNYFDRAILTGSSTNEFLNIVSTTGNIYKTYEGGTLSTELGEIAAAEDSKFQDGSNWTYSKTIYTQIDGTHTMGAVRIKAKAFNSEITDLLGYETDEVTGKPTTTPLTRTILATGTSNGVYEMSVFYDFKTNRIVNAWTPLGEMQIDEPLVVNADIMFVRHEQRDAAHIILGDQGSVKSLENVYFVLEFDRDTMKDQECHYWFSLPFDCKLSQVFGVEGYMNTWGIQYYDGKSRAENGFWADSESYFKWFTEEDYKNPETTLHAGEGYVLSFDKYAASWKEYDGKALLRLYFPSQVKGFDLNHSTQLTKEYENQPCTITRDNRDKKDGNWKIIGSMAYNNSTPETVSPSSETQGQTYADYPAFLYEYSEEAQEGKHFHAKDGKKYTYRAFFGYRVQFGGTITWLPQTESYPEQGIAARKHAMDGEKAHLTTRLELQKADGTKADQTFIALDINGTTGYDQNMDLGKITGSKQTTIYTTSEGADYAGNTLPMESQTVAVTVNTREAGTYTIAMPDGTEGVEMILIDSKTGNQTDLASGKYTVSLEKGNIADRFSIRINIRKTPTELKGAYNADGSKILKYIDNERLNILLNGKLYNAIGADVK
ncbi:MAG: InlB B-repeat-containing protein [Paludibacteraceae bacterium]|nr:InlB B-repeat-containing protein [Paludibacteraceae bacterium]